MTCSADGGGSTGNSCGGGYAGGTPGMSGGYAGMMGMSGGTTYTGGGFTMSQFIILQLRQIQSQLERDAQDITAITASYDAGAHARVQRIKEICRHLEAASAELKKL